MNIHHLELFYHVARHQGISRALPRIPYGIQQPAVSAQLIQLEKALGVVLFRRRPFKLTLEGEKLFAFARPFFERLDDVENELRNGRRYLRIASAEAVIRYHLPEPLRSLKAEFPGLHLTMRAIDDRSLEQLAHGELDLVIGAESGAIPEGVIEETLIEMRMLLLAPDEAKDAGVPEFLNRHAGETPLISLPEDQLVCRLFADELARRGLVWKPSLELGGLDLVRRYAAGGFGVGLLVEGALSEELPGMRVIPLNGFPRLRVSACHAGKMNSIAARLLEMIRDWAGRMRLGKAGRTTEPT